MVTLSVNVDKTEHSVEVSQETWNFFGNGAAIRQRPVSYYLTRVVIEYGSLTEENIIKFMDEKWVL